MYFLVKSNHIVVEHSYSINQRYQCGTCLTQTRKNFGSNKLPNIKYNTFKAEVGIDPKTVRKFLGIGAKVNLVEWESYLVEKGKDKGQTKGRFLQKKPSIKKKRITSADEAHIEDFTVWFQKPEIQKWFHAKANTRFK